MFVESVYMENFSRSLSYVQLFIYVVMHIVLKLICGPATSEFSVRFLLIFGNLLLILFLFLVIQDHVYKIVQILWIFFPCL